MVCGNYVINAEQAREITNSAIEIMKAIDDEGALAQAEAELRTIYGQISGAASRGEMSTDVFIMYQSNYDNLVQHGFWVHGGVIREWLPKREWKSFGSLSDLYCIEWGTDSVEEGMPKMS